MYTPRERIRFVAFGVAAGLLAIGISKLWFFPWLHAFAASAPCRTVFGHGGTAALLYGVFVGLPGFIGLVMAATFGRRGMRILRDGQVPPLGEKSFRLTRIRRGGRATVIGYLHIVMFVPFVALALWGSVQATALTRQVQRKAVDCTAAANPFRALARFA
ncbi:hypothetical protein FHW12_001015 [Dokdonella fugitiva]|uniref:Uncharacterized protein n=1 Tax=Dokdonella fugitiva TaxID=328517 RepID=A0A839F3E5_9GAMM|nr:hypothetical protein [Dokdonella fugitiva]MBA8886824.1 hypothetical protein [Dokdonella fugitiva]